MNRCFWCGFVAASAIFSIAFLGLIDTKLPNADPIAWETLLAGALALGAALWTVQKMQEQIKVQKEQIDEQRLQADDEKERKSITAKARAVSELSALHIYAEEVAQFLINEEAEKPELLPRESFDFLSAALENYTDEKTEGSKRLSIEEAEIIEQLFHEYQLLNARLDDVEEAGLFKADDEYITGTVKCVISSLMTLRRHVDLLFSPVRGEKIIDRNPKPYSNIANSLFVDWESQTGYKFVKKLVESKQFISLRDEKIFERRLPK